MASSIPVAKPVNKINRFGWVKFHRKPRTAEDYERVFARHRYLVPNLKELEVSYSRRGAGSAGIRHFRFEAIPPMAHHNPNLAIRITLHKDASPAVVNVVRKDGTSQVIECAGLKDAAILEAVYKVDGSSVERDSFRSEHDLLYFGKT